MSPTFSVVIPTYNQAEFLRKAANSVLAQTYDDFEVIIVNNYSADHTLEVVRELGDRRVRVINFQNNGVIGAGRNVGIKASHGAYVAFLDSDDTWYSNKLERIAQEIEKDPQVGLVCHDQNVVRDGRVVRRSHYGPHRRFQGNMYEYLLFVGNGPSTSATVVARQYLDEVGGFSENQAYVTVEDTDLWLNLARVCRFQFVNEILGTVHLHATSASANIEVHLRSGLAVLDKHIEGYQGSQRFNAKEAIRRHYAYTFYGAARQYQHKGAFKKSLVLYFRALRTYPFHLRAWAGVAHLLVGLPLAQARTTRIV